MHPFLKAGDSLHLCRVAPEQLRLGDLIAFRREDHLIVHRFAGRLRQDSQTWLRQKGDNLPGFGLIRPEELVGRVAFVATGASSRPMLTGFGLWQNRFLGCRAWMICLSLELGRDLARKLHLRAAP